MCQLVAFSMGVPEQLDELGGELEHPHAGDDARSCQGDETDAGACCQPAALSVAVHYAMLEQDEQIISICINTKEGSIRLELPAS